MPLAYKKQCLLPVVCSVWTRNFKQLTFYDQDLIAQASKQSRVAEKQPVPDAARLQKTVPFASRVLGMDAKALQSTKIEAIMGGSAPTLKDSVQPLMQLP